MKYASIVVIFAVMLTLVSDLVFAENIIDDLKNPTYLFTLAGKSGTFEEDTLTLMGVPLVVYFTDRPHRISGHISLEKFRWLWDKGVDNFEEDPPTAQLSVYSESGDKHDVLIISSPRVKGDTISFNVKELEESESIPKSFGHSTLFIDSLGMMMPSGQN